MKNKKYSQKDLEKLLIDNIENTIPRKWIDMIIHMMNKFSSEKTSYIEINMTKCVYSLYGYIKNERGLYVLNNKNDRKIMCDKYGYPYNILNNLNNHIRNIDDETIYRMFHYQLKDKNYITAKQFFCLLFERYGMK